MERPSVSRRQLLAGLSGSAALLSACGGPGAGTAPSSTTRHAPPHPNAQRKQPAPLLPGHRLIGWCGAPGSEALGAFTGDLDRAAVHLRHQLARYPHDKPALPVVELIATVAHTERGPDGLFRTRRDDATVRAYLHQARKLDGVLLLNIQPGRADLFTEARAYQRWLREPDVGLALDPEWAVTGDQVPGRRFGHTTGAVLDRIAAYLSGLVRQHHLPEKPMVYHQVAASVVTGQAALRPHPGVAPILSVDGVGSPALKRKAWTALMHEKPAHVSPGVKLFYDEDTRNGSRLLRPGEVLALRPQPRYVLYE